MTAAPFDTLKLSRQLQLPLELRQARRDAIRGRDHGNETFAEIARSYNVSGWTISRLQTQHSISNA
jgi:hypothetical protein